MSWDEREEKIHELEVKKSFEKHYKQLLEDDYKKFMECNKKYLRRAIRVNTLQADTKEIYQELTQQGWDLTPVPWCKHAFWIQGERHDVGNLLAHQLGQIYIQDPASMLPPIVLQPQENDIVLDMCASPGSKTTQAAAMMNNTGLIIANDAEGKRLAALGVNTQRLGVINTLLTNKDGREFAKYRFDKIMIDAPCSGTGTIRRSHKAIQQHNINQVRGFAKLQLQLLQAGYQALKEGGSLTYSTCSVEPLENECVVDAFIRTQQDAQLQEITLDIKREQPFSTHPETGKQLHKEVEKTLRIHPYTNDTEGFFVAHIKKPTTDQTSTQERAHQ